MSSSIVLDLDIFSIFGNDERISVGKSQVHRFNQVERWNNAERGFDIKCSLWRVNIITNLTDCQIFQCHKRSINDVAE